DDSVSACSRARVDAENLHAQRLGRRADVPPARDRAQPAAVEIVLRIELTCPLEAVTVSLALYFPALAYPCDACAPGAWLPAPKLHRTAVIDDQTSFGAPENASFVPATPPEGTLSPSSSGPLAS